MQVRATDADTGENAQLRYSIDESDTDLFWINAESGVMTLLDNIPTDNITWSVRVTATDTGTPPLSSTTNISFVVNSQRNDVLSGLAIVKSRESVDQRRLVGDSDTWTALIVVWIACCSGLVSLLVVIVIIVSVIRRRLVGKRVDKQQQQQQQQQLVSVDDGTTIIRHLNDLDMTSAICGDVIRCNGNNITIDKHHHYHHHHRNSSYNGNDLIQDPVTCHCADRLVTSCAHHSAGTRQLASSIGHCDYTAAANVSHWHNTFILFMTLDI